MIFISQNVPVFVRSLKGRRRYLLIENQSAFDIRVSYDHLANLIAREGISIISQDKYELHEPFTPNNPVIWLQGVAGATLQQVNVTQGF